MGTARKKCTQQYREEAVELVTSSGRSVAEVARDLGLNEGTLGNWVKAAKRSGSIKEKPLTIGERVRLKELEDENRKLRMERDFLKKQQRGLPVGILEVRLHPASPWSGGPGDFTPGLPQIPA
jgi:transposase